MAYTRPQPQSKPAKAERQAILEAYYAEYARLAERDPTVLNRKLPREVFADALNRVGALLIEESARLAYEPGPVREFLSTNALPTSLADRLPDEFRAFCLMLNALKQWTVAEQAATDRYLLGGLARTECREAVSTCLVAGSPLEGTVELHHPVRDGRPPIPLSRAAHAALEGQVSGAAPHDETRAALLALKREGSRSWVQLRKGCLDLLGNDVQHTSPNVGASSRTFARKAAQISGIDYQELLAWLDAHELGIS